MKKIGIITVFLFTLFTTLCPLDTTGKSNCMMAVTYSEMAYAQFKKVNKASSLDNAKKALKKALQNAKETAAYAAQCGCSNAETYSLSAFTIAEKGVDATSVEDLSSISKKAMDLSLDAMQSAQQCGK
ncbi:hypothetical protein [Dyadobacter sp. LHD-138]|uniref:hypothetical protein n=1 Tax=Dyadobacter sp. LHD-138 TaxID=3071413 RepID=UPI0027DF5FF9|nr:hypothetical protein [Dyadobacter sp. LHD-138]MDQ6482029.1 hypothetical protein [Dyadobacter sp. LHD-138]